jgi:hypothetical protein
MPRRLNYDHDRAVKVYCHLAKAWTEKSKGLSGITLPEVDSLPQEAFDDPLFHSQLLFFWSFLNQGGSKTREVMAKATELVLANRWLVDPREGVHQHKSMKVMHHLLPYGKKTKHRLSKYWQDNLERLRTQYDCDPRQIFLCQKSDKDRIRIALKEFNGIGDKIANLAAVWHQGVYWHDHQEEWERIRQISFALGDIWTLRQIYMFGILQRWETDHHKIAGPEIAEYAASICNECGISAYDVTQCSWVIGSDICSKRLPFDNPQAADYCRIQCPASDFCWCFVPALNYRVTGRIEWERHIIRPVVV